MKLSRVPDDAVLPCPRATGETPTQSLTLGVIDSDTDAPAPETPVPPASGR